MQILLARKEADEKSEELLYQEPHGVTREALKFLRITAARLSEVYPRLFLPEKGAIPSQNTVLISEQRTRRRKSRRMGDKFEQ